MKLFFSIIFSIFLINVNSFIYKVRSLSYLRKTLRILSSDNSFLHYINGDSHYLNYYYTTLYLGQNKTPQVYILDTGSSITTSPCDQCTNCGDHLNPKYHLENTSKIISCNDNKCKLASNSRCLDNKCSFRISYAEGSKLMGIYVNQDVFFETINLENNITNKSYSIPIGCTTTETHLFKTQLADGIMGLNNNDNSFVGMMYKLGIIQKNIFSLCFEHDGGYFSIGKIYDEFHYNNDIKYANLVNKNYGNYIINLKYLKIGDDKVEFNGKAVIDSGTTMSYFPPMKFNEMMKIILDKCKKSKKCGNLKRITNFGYCTAVKTEQDIFKIINEGWGNITFTFDDLEFIWNPKNYYYLYKPKDNEYYLCLGFDEDKRANILLGTTFMHGYDFIFDKEKHKIGIVEADCNRNIKNKNIKKENDNKNSDIKNDINVDVANFDTISDNKLINKSTTIDKGKDDINDIKQEQIKKLIKNSNNFDKRIIILCVSIICVTFLLFIIFNIILCYENYTVISTRKDDDDIDKFVLGNFKYDTTTAPISLFNDNI